MARLLVANRHRINGVPVTKFKNWVPSHNNRIVMYGITWVEDVDTKSGPMSKVAISKRLEVGDPSNDVIVLLGRIPWTLESGAQYELAPDLYNWVHPVLGDSYWVKAQQGGGMEYFKNGHFLLYRVDVEADEDFIASLNS